MPTVDGAVKCVRLCSGQNCREAAAVVLVRVRADDGFKMRDVQRLETRDELLVVFDLAAVNEHRFLTAEQKRAVALSDVEKVHLQRAVSCGQTGAFGGRVGRLAFQIQDAEEDEQAKDNDQDRQKRGRVFRGAAFFHGKASKDRMVPAFFSILSEIRRACKPPPGKCPEAA